MIRSISTQLPTLTPERVESHAAGHMFQSFMLSRQAALQLLCGLLDHIEVLNIKLLKYGNRAICLWPRFYKKIVINLVFITKSDGYVFWMLV